MTEKSLRLSPEALAEKTAIIQKVRSECKRRGLDENLLLAITMAESSFRVKTAQYERSYIWYERPEEFARAHGVSKDTETAFQKTSFGPMHIMGGSARWLGFRGWLPDLCDVEMGVYWGCAYFNKVCARYIYVNDQVAAYNEFKPKKDAAGRYLNPKVQVYVDRVLGLFDSYQKDSGAIDHVS